MVTLFRNSLFSEMSSGHILSQNYNRGQRCREMPNVPEAVAVPFIFLNLDLSPESLLFSLRRKVRKDKGKEGKMTDENFPRMGEDSSKLETSSSCLD